MNERDRLILWKLRRRYGRQALEEQLEALPAAPPPSPPSRGWTPGRRPRLYDIDPRACECSCGCPNDAQGQGGPEADGRLCGRCDAARCA